MTTPAHRHTVARTFDFPPHARSLLEPSDAAKIHLDAETNTLRLRAGAGGLYSTDADLYIRGQLFWPKACHQWLTPYVWTTEPEGTTVRYRLSDDTSDYYWDGAAWSVAGAGNWNTLQELQANIGAFASRKVRIVYGLATTDESVTPYVTRALLMFEAIVPSFDEEYLYRTLLRSIRDNAQAEADTSITWPGGTSTTFDPDTMEEPPGEFQEVTAAFDHTSDPDLYVDLLQSWTPGTKTVTLTQAVTQGNKVVLRLRYKPIVAFLTHPDYDEIAKLPAVAVSAFRQSLLSESPVLNYAVDRSTYEAVTVRAPRQVLYTVDLRVIASRSLDLFRLANAVETYLRRNPVLYSPALDVPVAVTVESPFDTTPRADATHRHEGSMSIQLRSAEKWIHPQEPGYGVEQVNVTISEL